MKKFNVGQKVALINPCNLNIFIKKYAIGEIITINRKTQELTISFNDKYFKSTCTAKKHSAPWILDQYNVPLFCKYKEICPLNLLTKYQLIKVITLKLIN